MPSKESPEMANQHLMRAREAQEAAAATERSNQSLVDNAAIARHVNALLLKCHARLAVNGLPYIDPADRVPETLPSPPEPWTRTPHPELEAKYLWAVLDAEDAAEMASRRRLSQQRARARLYLGHCFRALQQWKDALQCYIDAASVWGVYWGQADIQGLTRLCRWHLPAAPPEAKKDPGRMQELERHFSLPLVADASHSEEGFSVVTTPAEPLALMNDEGHIVGFMIETPELRRIKPSSDLKAEDWKRRKLEEERHPNAIRIPRVTYRRILSSPYL